jgi:hypothetical protein
MAVTVNAPAARYTCRDAGERCESAGTPKTL